MSPQNRQKKQVPARNTPLSAKPKKKLRIVLVILLLAFVAIGSALLYHHHTQQLAIDKERAQFAQTEKDLDALNDSITKQLGATYSTSRSNYCDRASNTNEFEKGDLICTVSRTLIYATDNKETAQATTSRIQVYLGSSMKSFKVGYTSTASANTSPPTELSASDLLDLTSGLNCSITYTYYPHQSLYNQLVSAEIPRFPGDGIIVISSCGVRPAKAVYYPLKD